MELTFKQKLICRLALLGVWILHATYRYRWYGLAHYEAACLGSAQGNPLVACWHQNSLASAMAHAGRRLAIIVSQSFDGEIISSVVKHFGIESARGSSHRGGLEALRAILKLVKKGYEAGITVDGPKGPIYKVKPGVVAIASSSGSAILPLIAVGRKTWSLPTSWDRFRIPKPFTQVLCVYGAPLHVPRKLDAEAQRLYAESLEAALMELEQQLQQWCKAGILPPSEHKGLRPTHK